MSYIMDTEGDEKMICELKRIREQANITQEELAKKSGISRYIISKLENGEDVNITKKTMIAIANALERTVTEIFLF